MIARACVFCEIIAGRAEASFVYRDEQVAAFMDIHQPPRLGHLLVVPVGHAAHLADLDEETGGRIFQVGMRLAAALRVALGCPGVNFYLADGAAAGQEVPHVHLHLLARFRGDGFGLRTGPGYARASRADLDRVAARIRRSLDGVRKEPEDEL